MPDHEQGMIDILEIYHARRVRDELLSSLRRLRNHNPFDPFQDLHRRRDTCAYYEAMFLTVAELLHELGDDAPLV